MVISRFRFVSVSRAKGGTTDERRVVKVVELLSLKRPSTTYRCLLGIKICMVVLVLEVSILNIPLIIAFSHMFPE